MKPGMLSRRAPVHEAMAPNKTIDGEETDEREGAVPPWPLRAGRSNDGDWWRQWGKSTREALHRRGIARDPPAQNSSVTPYSSTARATVWNGEFGERGQHVVARDLAITQLLAQISSVDGAYPSTWERLGGNTGRSTVP